MYTPTHFRIEDRSVLFDFISKNNFGILVTIDHSTPIATHLPFLIEPDRGERGTLIGHIAKANTQWQSFSSQSEALVIFQGAHTYISPSWYQSQPSVPTWNYATIHAYGVPRIIDDAHATHNMLGGLVNKHEAAFEQPWEMKLPDDYYRQQTNAIVVFEIELMRLEGKFKMSQNRSAEDRSGVIAALEQSGDDNSIEVAHSIKQASR
ncbi:MAG TPA: FMN-binding negative transcriptional regulator [Anaerolineae bacterium]|nr:FMN-binding negative transcriptional regulator [Anaerolineae bacterium]